MFGFQSNHRTPWGFHAPYPKLQIPYTKRTISKNGFGFSFSTPNITNLSASLIGAKTASALVNIPPSNPVTNDIVDQKQDENSCPAILKVPSIWEDPVHLLIKEYVAQGQVHNYFGIKVDSIIPLFMETNYKEQLQINSKMFKRRQGKEFRMMLWHGTKNCNVSSIMKNGFIIPELNNQMFGAGIYFADRAAKSGRYCDGTSEGSEGTLILCEVKLGALQKCHESRHGITEPPSKKCQSVRGSGRNVPDWREDKILDDCVWPVGKTVQKRQKMLSPYRLSFNEFVVYKTEQIIPKYLVRITFTAEKYYEKNQ